MVAIDENSLDQQQIIDILTWLLVDITEIATKLDADWAVTVTTYEADITTTVS